MSIVVVEDERAVCEGTALMLRRWGCEPLLADGMESALALLGSDGAPAIDAIISDYRLRNNTTGLEVIEALRRATERPLPALLVSGDSDPERIVAARAGGFPLLHKPVPPGELRRALYAIMTVR